MTNVLQALLHLAVFSLFEPDDDFSQKLRKFATQAWGIIGLIVPTGYLFYYGYLAINGAESSTWITAATCFFGFSPTLMGVAVHTRFTRHVGNAKMAFLLWVLVINLLIVGLTLPLYAIVMVQFNFMILAILSSTIHMVPIMLFSLVAQLLNAWNTAVIGAEGHDCGCSHGNQTLVLPKLTIPAPFISPPIEHFIHNFSGIFIGCISLGLIYAQTRVHQQSIRAAVANVALANDVVLFLRNYDTDAVAKKLLAENLAEDVDPKLVKALKDMNANLESYRPFLPNYMFLKGVESSDVERESDDEGEISMNQSGIEDEDCSGSDTIRSPRLSSSGHKASKSAKHRGGLDGARSGGRCYASTSASDNTSVDSEGSVHSCSYADHSMLRNRIDTRNAKITMAYLDCRSSCFADDKTLRVDGEKLIAFVDAIYETARTTQAAVHSMLGDCVQVSWNAAHKVAQPEMKGARFLARLKDLAKQCPGLSLAGALCTGHASCHSVTSKSKQQALIVHTTCQPRLDGAFDLARRYRTFLIDASTHAVSHYDVEAQPVDQIFYKADSGDAMVVESMRSADAATCISPGRCEWRFMCDGQRPTPTSTESPSQPAVPFHVTENKVLLYEVLQEINHKEDEWMYQLEHREKQETDAAVVSKGVVSILQGRYQEALEKLRSHFSEGGVNQCTPMTQRLIKYCEPRAR